MDEYTKLKLKIEQYLEKNKIELSSNQLSVATLITILENELENLRNIRSGEVLKNEIRKSYTVEEKVGKIFKKKAQVCKRRCDRISIACNEKTTELTFELKQNDCERSEFLKLCKDVGDNQIYFSEHSIKDKSFVEKHYDHISEYFKIIEEYNTIFPRTIDDNNFVEQLINDGFFLIRLTCNTYGNVSITTTIYPKEDPDGLYKREWFERESLQEIYKEHEEEILKRIPVNINSLNYTMKTLVEEASSKQCSPVLVKKK